MKLDLQHGKYKLHVNSIQSAGIQRRLFAKGFKWLNGDIEVKHTDKSYLYLEDKSIFMGDDKYYYEKQSAEELNPLELIKILIENSLLHPIIDRTLEEAGEQIEILAKDRQSIPVDLLRKYNFHLFIREKRREII